DFGGLQGSELWVERLRTERAGAYVEGERAFGRFRFDAGVRYDHHTLPARDGVDPRLSVAWQATPRLALHLASGIYHQAPDAPLPSATVGSPELEREAARHWVLSYTAGADGDPLHLRIDAYDKRYTRLPFERGSDFCSCGFGGARGVDLILQVTPAGRWHGWM